MKPITKYSEQVVDGGKIPSMVRDAFRVAIEERPGAVYIELPEDIADEQTDASLFDVVACRQPDAGAVVIDQALAMIDAAERPLLLIGAGANRKSTGSALKEFVGQDRDSLL